MEENLIIKLKKFSEKKLKYKFKNIETLYTALKHSSTGKNNNEKLEFIGDSILNLIISIKLYTLFPNSSEGELTRIRSNLIKKNKLFELAKKINISKYILLGSSIKKKDKKKSIIANAIEAVIGSIYIDGGFKKASKTVNYIYKNEIKNDELFKKDSKTILQEILQNNKIEVPKYELVKIKTKKNIEKFYIKCTIAILNISSIGKGLSKKDAEQQSAKKIIIKIEDKI